MVYKATFLGELNWAQAPLTIPRDAKVQFDQKCGF